MTDTTSEENKMNLTFLTQPAKAFFIKDYSVKAALLRIEADRPNNRNPQKSVKSAQILEGIVCDLKGQL